MTPAAPGSLPERDLVRRVEHGNGSKLQRRCDIGLGYPVQNRNARRWHQIGNCLSLSPMGDEIFATTGLPEPWDYRACAEAIGIRLDRSARLCGSAELRHRCPVRRQRLSVEPQAKGRRKFQSRSLSLFSGSQIRLTMKAMLTTPTVYHSPMNAPPVFTTIYCEIKGRKPPK